MRNDRAKNFYRGKQSARPNGAISPWPMSGQNEAEVRTPIWGVTNCISTVSKDNYLVTKENVLMETKTENQKQRKHGLPSEMLHLDNLPEELKGKKVYIRKLTPRECFRLMDVSEDNIDKMILPKDDKGKPIISKSKLYCLAGNSIVVSCMEYMFRNILFGPSDLDKQNVAEEYPLFADMI